MLEKAFHDYQTHSLRQFNDHHYFCYHSPVPRLVEKAHQHLLKVNGLAPSDESKAQIEKTLYYAKRIGNCYAASLYIGLASLLDLAKEDLSNKRIGFYSYGSGCVAEYFSGIVQTNYRQALKTNYHTHLLNSREELDYAQYKAFFSFNYPEDGSDQVIKAYNTGDFRLTRFEQHKRIYEKIPKLSVVNTPDEKKEKVRSNIRAASAANEGIIKVLAPGKLILSGEHAVVYGKPAMAMAINRYVTATVTRETRPQILFDLSDLAHHSRLSFTALHHLKERIKRKYHRFIRGDFSIREVLQKPFELAQFALGVLAEAHNLSLPHGVKIHLQSDIPIGCGMGSSAATIVSVMQAASHYLQIPLSQDALFRLALEAEKMQHGYSSGLDLHVALQGGCLYIENGKIEERSIPDMPLYLINTGSPLSSTGQCVEKVAPFFKSKELQEDFAEVTQAMDKALAGRSWQEMQAAIRANHILLSKIGVVPDKIRQFVSQIELVGGAAKICGAGAIQGDHAGALLVATEDKNAVQTLCMQFGYKMIPISGETRGVHAA